MLLTRCILTLASAIALLAPAATCSAGVGSGTKGSGTSGSPAPTAAVPEDTLPLCTDGLDNDGDGLIDGADPDCAGHAPVQISYAALSAASCTEGAASCDGIDIDVTVIDRAAGTASYQADCNDSDGLDWVTPDAEVSVDASAATLTDACNLSGASAGDVTITIRVVDSVADEDTQGLPFTINAAALGTGLPFNIPFDTTTDYGIHSLGGNWSVGASTASWSSSDPVLIAPLTSSQELTVVWGNARDADLNCAASGRCPGGYTRHISFSHDLYIPDQPEFDGVQPVKSDQLLWFDSWSATYGVNLQHSASYCSFMWMDDDGNGRAALDFVLNCVRRLANGCSAGPEVWFITTPVVHDVIAAGAKAHFAVEVLDNTPGEADGAIRTSLNGSQFAEWLGLDFRSDCPTDGSFIGPNMLLVTNNGQPSLGAGQGGLESDNLVVEEGPPSTLPAPSVSGVTVTPTPSSCTEGSCPSIAVSATAQNRPPGTTTWYLDCNGDAAPEFIEQEDADSHIFTGQCTNYTGETPGNYIIRVTVVDSGGAFATRDEPFVVLAQDPIEASAGGPYQTDEATASVAVSGSCSRGTPNWSCTGTACDSGASFDTPTQTTATLSGLVPGSATVTNTCIDGAEQQASFADLDVIPTGGSQYDIADCSGSPNGVECKHYVWKSTLAPIFSCSEKLAHSGVQTLPPFQQIDFSDSPSAYACRPNGGGNAYKVFDYAQGSASIIANSSLTQPFDTGVDRALFIDASNYNLHIDTSTIDVTGKTFCVRTYLEAAGASATCPTNASENIKTFRLTSSADPADSFAIECGLAPSGGGQNCRFYCAHQDNRHNVWTPSGQGANTTSTQDSGAGEVQWDDMRAKALRAELCIDHDSGTGIATSRERYSVVEANGAVSKWSISELDFVNTNATAKTGEDMFITSGPFNVPGSPAEGLAISHEFAIAVDRDPAFWIGGACEIEAGAEHCP